MNHPNQPNPHQNSSNYHQGGGGNRWAKGGRAARGRFNSRYNNNNQGGNQGGNPPRYGRGNEYNMHDDREMDGAGYGCTGGPSKANQGNFRNNSRKNMQNNRRGNNQKNRYTMDNRRGQKSKDPNSRWFKMSVPQGSKCSKDYLVSQISELLGEPLVPYNYQINGESAYFFVMGEELSNTIRSMSKRISLPTREPLAIFKSESFQPSMVVTPEFIEQLKVIMSQRYLADTKLLNLSNFAADQGFKQLCMYVSMQKSNLLTVVVKIIRENIPDLMAVDLSNNRIQTLEPLSKMHESCKFLKAINLSSNELQHVNELDHLKGLEIEELNVKGNPFLRNHKDETAFVSLIRSKFTKLLKLNDADLPPPICFDVEDESTKIPAKLPSYMPEATTNFVSKFLEQYYLLFDSEDRQPLLAAYHEQAMFSFSIWPLNENNKNKSKYENVLINQNRNLLRIKDDQRTKLLKHGKVNVVAALCEMPKVKHSLDSFIVDVPLYNDSVIALVVNGVLRIVEPRATSAVKAFCRSFIIIPQGGGFVITNDSLFITNASIEQVKKASLQKPDQSNVAEMEMQGADFSNQVANSSGFASTSAAINSVDAQRQLILKQFCEYTKMNSSFAHQCLTENNYDPNRAMEVFSDLNSRGLIPAEAFISS